MSFCPRCGKILIVIHKNKPLLQCPKCGYKEKLEAESVLSKRRMINHMYGGIAVIDEKSSGLRTSPIAEVICPECGKIGSETWTAGVGSENAQSSFIFFKCTSCGHTRRETE